MAKKLIRNKIADILEESEYEEITDKAELNRLYALKIKEELLEIQISDHKDINEFADLIQIVMDFAIKNGFSKADLLKAIGAKLMHKGGFDNLVLKNVDLSLENHKVYDGEYFDNIPIPYSPLVAKKLLRVRDNFLKDDDEAWHNLYSIASPKFDKIGNDVWTDMENHAKLSNEELT